MNTAPELIEEALATIAQRGVDYDKPQGERSMAGTVAMFNLHTGHGITVEQGWLFMLFLKLERIKANPKKPDNFVDLSGYGALYGEECLGSLQSKDSPPGPDYARDASGEWKPVPLGEHRGPCGEKGPE